MILLLSYFIACKTNITDFNIIPPFKERLNEVGFWSLIGSALRTKDYIRLTNLYNNDFGAVCLRRKIHYAEWKSDITFKISSKNGTQKTFVYFSEDFCIKENDYWEGLRIEISSNNGDNHINATYRFSDTINLYSTADFKLYKNDSLRIIISYEYMYVLVGVKNDDFIPLLRCKYLKLPGYISINSYSDSFISENDIKSIKFTNLSNEIIITDRENEALEYKNRKYLWKVKKNYALVTEAIEKMNKKLSNNETNLFSGSLSLITDIIKRAENGITSDQFDKTIHEKLEPVINMSLHTIENAEKTLSNFREEITNIFDKTTSSLNLIKDDLIEEINNFTIFLKEVNLNPKKYKNVEIPEPPPVSLMLYFISLAELVIFIFVSYKRYHKYNFSKKEK